MNGKLKPNLADAELWEEIKDDPDEWPGYVPMIRQVQDNGTYDLRKAIKFIRKGGASGK
jgi:hypothetical protein